MALAPRRQQIWTEVHFALNEVAERGKIVCINAGTTAAGEVTGLATATGLNIHPVGVLLDDVENMNYDRHGEFLNRNVSDVGSVVGIGVKGDYETNLLVGTPVAGKPAYLGASGYISANLLLDGASGKNSPQVGYFRTVANANGYALVHIDL